MILEMAHDDYLTLLDMAETAPDRKGQRLAVILTRTYDGWTPCQGSAIQIHLGSAKRIQVKSMTEKRVLAQLA